MVPVDQALAFDALRGWHLIVAPPAWWLEQQEQLLREDEERRARRRVTPSVTEHVAVA